MRIGYTSHSAAVESRRLSGEGQCDKVVVGKIDDLLSSFLTCIKEHAFGTIVVVNIESIGLTLVKYETVLTALKTHQVKLVFLEKELADDETYVRLLASLAGHEHRVMSQRTHDGLKKAQEQGKICGRPSLSATTITQIQQLFFYQKKTLREIAEITGVSLGTVHKYTQQAKTNGGSRSVKELT